MARKQDNRVRVRTGDGRERVVASLDAARRVYGKDVTILGYVDGRPLPRPRTAKADETKDETPATERAS